VPGYIAFYALLVNLALAAIATLLWRLSQNELGAARTVNPRPAPRAMRAALNPRR